MNRMFISAALFVGISLCTFASVPSFAATYRWVDDNGIVNYAERLPRDVPVERVTKIEDDNNSRSRSSTNNEPAPTPVAAPSSSTQRSSVPLNNNQKDLMQDLQAAEKVRQEQVAKIRQDNCDRSRRVLNNLSAKSRIRVRGEDGTERALGEDERQERITAAQRGIAENCDA